MPISHHVSLSSRSSGILLHPTSLPGPYAFGDLGTEARRFAQFLQDSGQRWWQMCPLNPPVHGGSPYQSISSFAGNPSLISLEDLVSDRLLLAEELGKAPSQDVDASQLRSFKHKILDLAFNRFEKQDQTDFNAFREKNKYWLGDYSLFCALRKHYGKQPWSQWPASLRRREQKILGEVSAKLESSRRFHEFVQFIFFRQLGALQAFCSERGIGLMGDTSIYVAHDSADVWANQSFFELDAAGMPAAVGGTPPDLFTVNGQSWGMPTYRWEEIKKDEYRWWIERFKTAFETFDAVRLDHFIGYSRFWRIPASSPTARGGAWVEGPGADFFKAILPNVPNAQFVAEDLGAVAADVEALRDQFKFPGMKVLQFAFAPDSASKTFLPENHHKDDVVYTGTHDNDTTLGWYNDLLDKAKTDVKKKDELNLLIKYIGSASDVHWKMIELAMNSKANTCIVPLQDVLGLGSEARLNDPANPDSNWKWRFQWRQVPEGLAEKLKTVITKAKRTP